MTDKPEKKVAKQTKSTRPSDRELRSLVTASVEAVLGTDAALADAVRARVSEDSMIEGAMPLANTRHEAFALARAKGMTQAKAAVLAGFSKATATVSGNRLEKKVKNVAERISFLRNREADMDGTLESARQQVIKMGGPDLIHGITSKWLCLEFYRNCILARAEGNFREANYSLVYIAKLHKKMGERMTKESGQDPHPRNMDMSSEVDGDDYNGEADSVSERPENSEGVGIDAFSVPAPQEALAGESEEDFGAYDEDDGT